MATTSISSDLFENQLSRSIDQEDICITCEDFSLSYGTKQALFDINLKIPTNRATAFIGPSGCGKSTLLRCMNRMNDLIDGINISGQMKLHGKDINTRDVNVTELRQQVGMVFQKPNPFPKSIFENVAYGLRLQGITNKTEIEDRVEWSLVNSALWGEVGDRLQDNAFSLSGGQQQRLVIARAIAVRPQVLLLDEPASALDPISTLKIEELIAELKSQYTVVIVTHNMQQAARVSDYTAFLYLGKLIEFGPTNVLFTAPGERQTEDYITGRYG